MAKTKPIRIGLVGCGRAGWGMHCNEINGKEDMFQVVAACDLMPERTQRMAEKYGCKTYDNLKDMLADPDVELVDIATRSDDHFDHAMMALKAGKHVFVEKPMTVHANQAEKLLKAAEKSAGNLYVRHNRRFDPDFLHVQEIIKTKVLGDIYQIKLHRHGYGRRDDWQTVISCGGGQLLNWGPHIIDHALRLLESPVKSVWSDLKKIAALGDAEDHLKIVLTGENGRIAEVEISGGAAKRLPEYVIFGTKGGLIAEGGTISLRYLDPKKKLPPRKLDAGTPMVNSFGTPEELPWIEEQIPVAPSKTFNIWDELFTAIRKRRKFPITLEQSLQVMEVVTAAKKGTPFEYKIAPAKKAKKAAKKSVKVTAKKATRRKA